MSDADAPRQGSHRAEGEAQTDDPRVEALQADIERTREQLASTVDQLQAKLDVKARASAGAHDLADRAKEKVVDPQGNPRPAALGAGGALVAGIAAVVIVTWWRRRQRQRQVFGKRWR